MDECRSQRDAVAAETVPRPLDRSTVRPALRPNIDATRQEPHHVSIKRMVRRRPTLRSCDTGGWKCDVSGERYRPWFSLAMRATVRPCEGTTSMRGHNVLPKKKASGESSANRGLTFLLGECKTSKMCPSGTTNSRRRATASHKSDGAACPLLTRLGARSWRSRRSTWCRVRCAHCPVVRVRSTSAGANAYVANEEDVFCSDQINETNR